MNILKKSHDLTPTERYQRELRRQNLPWTIMKALAVLTLVGMFVLIDRHGRSGPAVIPSIQADSPASLLER